ncbi:MAG: NosD domain-containing protein [Methanosarcina sp.]
MNKKNKLQFLAFACFFFLIVNGTAAAMSVPSTLYVDAQGNGNYTTIQAAVGNATSGDTILVYPGTYTENVNVSVENISIRSFSGNPEDTIVKRLNVLSHNFKITANNVTISGFNITGTNSTGIYMSGFSGANITNNKLSGVGCGVQIESSSRCSLTNNTIIDSAEKGFYLDSSSNCTIADNTVSDTGEEGILLEYSDYCTLANNGISNTDSYGIYLYHSVNCILTGNTVSNTSDDGIHLSSSNYCTLANNTVSNSYDFGIYLYYSGNCNLTGNAVSNTYADSIYLYYSSNCNLTGNTVSDGYDTGICLEESENCTLAGSTVSNFDYEGIYLWESGSCVLTSNAVTNSDGIYLDDSDECILRNNTASSGMYGIDLWDSENCTLTGNVMSGNRYNFDLYSSDFNNVTGNIIDTSNLVDGKPIYYLEGEQNPSIGSDAGVIYCINCGKVEIKDFVLQNNSRAVFLYNTSSEMQNNTINNTIYGITALSSQDVRLSGSRIDNSLAGIILEEAMNTTLADNTVRDSMFGIEAYGSENCMLTNNSIQDSLVGIATIGSRNFTLTDNSVRNSIFGIATLGSENCTLTGNFIQESMEDYDLFASGNSKLVRDGENTLIRESALINSNLVQDVGSYGSGIYSISSQNLKLENNIIDQIGDTGIYLEGCQNTRLVSNSILNIGCVGIYLDESSSVELLDNTVQNVTGTSMLFDAGVRESTLTNSNLVQVSNPYGFGIFAEYSQDLRLENNTIDRTGLAGILLGRCQNAELVSNSVRDVEYIGIYAAESSSVELLDNAVQNITGEYMLPAAGNFSLVSSPLVSRSMGPSGYGIYFDYSEGIRLKGNTVKDSYQVWGIYLSEPVNATLESNTLENCQGGLITVLGENFSVSDCSVTNCTSGGILIINPEEGIGTGYTVSGCTVDGSDIGLLVTGEGTLSGNTLSGNSYGLMLYDVNNSQIYGNTMIQNSLAGIAIDPDESEIMARSGLVRSMESPASGNNTIYNNYFNNVNNTLINSEANNTWNTSKIAGESIVGGPYLGGNYWANPNGTGFSENCTDADRDGISDSSYEIVNGTFDYLPLKIIPSTTTRHKSSANYIPSSGSSGVTGTDGAQKRVVAGTQTTFNFNNPVSGVLGLSFTSQQYSGNVIVRIEVLDGVSGEKPEGEVYQQMNILVGNERFESGSNINGASINFRVSKSWVEENNIDVSTIKINRFHGEEWNALVTEMTGEDEEFYYFTAETPGFSRYAVTGDKLGTEIITPAEEETGTVTGEEQTNGVEKSTPGFESTFAVFGILASVFFAKKRILK